MIIRPLSRSYDGRKVLDIGETEIQRGLIYAVIGSNGSGKSTFAKIISGINKDDIGGRVFDSALKVGYMPQKSFAFRMTVKNNLKMLSSDTERAERILSRMNLEHLADKNAKNLSGGETARLSFARLAMKDFDVLVLDEPTASMDMDSALKTEKFILDYRQEYNCAVILITHSIAQAKRISDRIMFFHDGKILESGNTDEILSCPETPELKRFISYYGD